MNKYILGTKIIETTEKRYESEFKAMGYIPYVEKKESIKKSIEKVIKEEVNKDKTE